MDELVLQDAVYLPTDHDNRTNFEAQLKGTVVGGFRYPQDAIRAAQATGAKCIALCTVPVRYSETAVTYTGKIHAVTALMYVSNVAHIARDGAAHALKGRSA